MVGVVHGPGWGHGSGSACSESLMREGSETIPDRTRESPAQAGARQPAGADPALVWVMGRAGRLPTISPEQPTTAVRASWTGRRCILGSKLVLDRRPVRRTRPPPRRPLLDGDHCCPRGAGMEAMTQTAAPSQGTDVPCWRDVEFLRPPSSYVNGHGHASIRVAVLLKGRQHGAGGHPQRETAYRRTT